MKSVFVNSNAADVVVVAAAVVVGLATYYFRQNVIFFRFKGIADFPSSQILKCFFCLVWFEMMKRTNIQTQQIPIYDSVQ